MVTFRLLLNSKQKRFLCFVNIFSVRVFHTVNLFLWCETGGTIMYGDELITLFAKLNVRIGDLEPRVIKAWFDTDCKDLLEWICASITEDCYISPQEEHEYSRLENVLTGDKLEKIVKAIELEYPDLFQVETNEVDIEIANDIIEVLEEQLEGCENQLNINQRLKSNLAAEYSEVSSQLIKSQLELEETQEKCMKLSQELDRVNKETHTQVVKYASALDDFESAQHPKFINNGDITEFEEKFDHVVDILRTFMISNNYSLRLGDDMLSEIKNRIFYSTLSRLKLEMEVEAQHSVLKFYETLNLYSLNSLAFDCNFTQMEIEENKDCQNQMMVNVEKLLMKYAEQCVNEPSLRFYKNELNFYVSRLENLNVVEERLKKILVNFNLMHNMFLQEKMDIQYSSSFLKDMHKYIQENLKQCYVRKQKMLKKIDEYEKFSIKPVEEKLKLVRDFQIVLSKDVNTLQKTLQESTKLKIETTRLKNKHFNFAQCFKSCLQSHNVEILRNFLICGPTFQIVTIPHGLQMLLFQVDQTLAKLQTSTKMVVAAARKPKELVAKDKWLRYRNQLWMLFMTDPEKMKRFLCQFAENENCEITKLSQTSKFGLTFLE
ncbi:uncharacterized protein LOC103313822 isoform X2 [Tribolium castaneum]|uniref:uncharacterized protein LOC103313822 isoform X2 n=1 Tax=Tribolium castaneum TaxID=7070 RepID=UPI00046BEFC3